MLALSGTRGILPENTEIVGFKVTGKLYHVLLILLYNFVNEILFYYSSISSIFVTCLELIIEASINSYGLPNC